MAQVVLENVYKTFPPRHRGNTAAPPESVLTPTMGGAPSDTKSAQTSGTSVLRRINLTIFDGEFMVLVGPSGCGKSTLLRLIAGLEQLTGGNIWVGDRQVNTLPPKQRDIAMVFQNYALYPHLSVYDNLAFGLRRNPQSVDGLPNPVEGKPNWSTLTTARLEDAAVALTRSLPHGLRYRSAKEQAIAKRVQTVAQMLQIEMLLDRLPKQLSGGQKQRVALGRAMARNPQVFLMDEPLSNLDAKLRTETRSQIVNLQRKLGITTIYVTHDQVEAMTMGDRIAVMNEGQIQQVATPLEVYTRPANRFVAEFIGSPPMNFLPVQVKSPLLVTHPLFRLTLPELWETALRRYDGRTTILGIRPEHLNLSVPAPKNIPVRVSQVEALGSETYLTVDLSPSGSELSQPETNIEPARMQVRVEAERGIRLGEELWLSIATDRLHLFDVDTGAAIVPHD